MQDGIVLAYSGRRDESLAIRRLAGEHRAVMTMTLDLGRERGLDEIRERALAAGALRAHVLDVREEFAREFLLPALRAGALGGARQGVAAALRAPLVAAKLVEIAAIEGVPAVAHGYDGARRTCVERAMAALSPSIRVIAIPFGSPMPGAAASDPGVHTPSRRHGGQLEAAPGGPAVVEVAFERGVPVALNGVAMTLTELIDCLTTIGAAHQVDAGATYILHVAHAGLERAVSTDSARGALADEYMQVVCGSGWFTPARGALDAVVAAIQQRVTGAVRLRLFRGACAALECRPIFDHPAAAAPVRA